MDIVNQIKKEAYALVKRFPYIPLKETLIKLKWDYIGFLPCLGNCEEFNNLIVDFEYEITQYAERKRRKI